MIVQACYSKLPAATYKFVDNKKIQAIFLKRWLHVWAVSNSFVASYYYADDRFKVWRFMGAT